MSDNEIYFLIKYIKSFLWRVAKRLSYIEDAWCLKAKSKLQVGTYHVLAASLCSSKVTCFLLFIHFFFCLSLYLSFPLLLYVFLRCFPPFPLPCFLPSSSNFFRLFLMPFFVSFLLSSSQPFFVYLSAHLFFVSFLSRLIPCCLSFCLSSLPFRSSLYPCKLFCTFSMDCRVPFVTEVLLVG